MFHGVAKNKWLDSKSQIRIQQARHDYYKRLREKAEVSILLSAPKVEVKADPGRLRGDAKAPLTIVEFSDFASSGAASNPISKTARELG